MEKFSISSILLLIVFSCNGQAIYWEDLPESQKTQIIDFVSSEIVLQHLNGKIKLSDDSLTFVLLNELSNPNDTLLPLYFYLFIKIHEISDGALGSMISSFCYKYILRFPEFLFGYFQSHANRKMLDKYANSVGFELYFNDEDVEEFKRIIDMKVDRLDLQPTLRIFWQEVDKALNYLD